VSLPAQQENIEKMANAKAVKKGIIVPATIKRLPAQKEALALFMGIKIQVIARNVKKAIIPIKKARVPVLSVLQESYLEKKEILVFAKMVIILKMGNVWIVQRAISVRLVKKINVKQEAITQTLKSLMKRVA